MPVYRQSDDGALELASSDWKGSSPNEVTKWYNRAVCDKSPDKDNGRQLRRVTRHLKAYKNSRISWKLKMASGFVISVLAVECYVPDDRDDVALYKTIKAICDRLNWNLEVRHPVRNEMLTKGLDDSRTKFLREKLSEALSNLEVLFYDYCKLSTALRAWENVFKHQFWTDRATEEEAKDREESKQEKSKLLRQGNAELALVPGLIAAISSSAACAKQTEAYGGKKNW